MIDIHNHILHGLDDGAESLQESLEMAKLAAAEGIDAIIATPHHANGRYDNEGQVVIGAVQHFARALAESKIPLKIWPGLEVRVCRDLLQDLEDNKLLTLAGSKYLLIELPPDRVPDSLEELLFELKLLRIVPIIAHPERNRGLSDNMDTLQSMIEQGALSQITALSVIGGFGKTVQKTAMEFCRRNLVHFIATDAHNTRHRAFGLGEAYRIIKTTLGEDYEEYYRSNASAVLENRDITVRDIRRPPKKWYFFWKKG